MWLKKIVFFFLLASIISCSDKKNRLISFHVDVSYEESGTFFDKSLKQELVFFAKKRFNPSLKVFDGQGNLQDSVSLKEAEKKVGQISKVWMTSKESIFVFSSNTQQYAVVNSKGTVVCTKKINHNTSDENNNLYDFYPPFMQSMDMRFGNDVIYTTFWSGNSQLADKQDKSLIFVTDNIRKGYLMYRETTAYSQSAKQFGVQLRDFTELNASEKYIFYPYYKTLKLNSRNFLLSYYSKYIYELDSNLKVINHFEIMPNGLPLARPVLISGYENNLLSKEEELDNQTKENCFISNLLYNKEKDRFIAIIKNGGVEDNLFAYPFLIQIYSNNWDNLVKSYKYDTHEYMPASSFILFDNLYIEKKSSDYERKYFEIIAL